MQIAIEQHIIFQLQRFFSAFHKSEKEITEEQKIVLLAQQNPNHFSKIYDQYYDQIFVFIYKKTYDENTTAELTSEVFYKALYNLKKYKFKGLPFSSWLYRIASNATIEHFRKQKKVQRHISIESNQLAHLASEVSESSDLEKKRQLLISALGNLKEKEIQLIELRYFEEFSFKEIGQIIGLTENNAKVKTFRVIKKIQKLIKS